MNTLTAELITKNKIKTIILSSNVSTFLNANISTNIWDHKFPAKPKAIPIPNTIAKIIIASLNLPLVIE